MFSPATRSSGNHSKKWEPVRVPGRRFGRLFTAMFSYAAFLSVTLIAASSAADPSLSLEYRLFARTSDSDRAILAYDVIVRNDTDGSLSSVRAYLRKAPAYMTVPDPSIEFGFVPPFGRSESNDTFSISVLEDLHMPAEVDLQWEIVYVDDSGLENELYIQDQADLGSTGL